MTSEEDMQNGHAQQSRQFLTQAREELDKGGIVQASEKLSGAAARMVKAVAERRRWRHDSHRSLIDAVNRLAQETGDRRLMTAFGLAQTLHTNFYETAWPREFVENGIQEVEELVNKLERL